MTVQKCKSIQQEERKGRCLFFLSMPYIFVTAKGRIGRTRGCASGPAYQDKKNWTCSLSLFQKCTRVINFYWTVLHDAFHSCIKGNCHYQETGIVVKQFKWSDDCILPGCYQRKDLLIWELDVTNLTLSSVWGFHLHKLIVFTLDARLKFEHAPGRLKWSPKRNAM